MEISRVEISMIFGAAKLTIVGNVLFFQNLTRNINPQALFNLARVSLKNGKMLCTMELHKIGLIFGKATDRLVFCYCEIVTFFWVGFMT